MIQTTPHPTGLICVVGPTASGKSAVARALAMRWPVEIINVDSATIYQGMDIGTAKPDASERAQVTHHLLDIIDPAQRYSVAQFQSDVQTIVAAIRTRGRTPVLVGGTMMYVNALTQGLHDLPSANAAIRQTLEQEAAEKGWPAMHEKLKTIDPMTAARLAAHDSQRIGRALEVWQVSGKPLSEWLTEPKPASERHLNLRLVSLEPSNRLALHERIAKRFDGMLAMGLVQEVHALFERGDLHSDLPSIRCVGYRQIWRHLAGQQNLESSREQAIAATRQLAKRQLTWLRSMSHREVFDCLDTHSTDRVVNAVAAQLDRTV